MTNLIEQWEQEIYQIAVSAEYAADCVRSIKKKMKDIRRQTLQEVLDKIKKYEPAIISLGDSNGIDDCKLIITNLMKDV